MRVWETVVVTVGWAVTVAYALGVGLWAWRMRVSRMARWSANTGQDQR
jgi:hypothetical protein